MSKTKDRNFVAKNAQTCGAGRHEAKKGKFASRNRQKKQWKQEVRQLI